LHAGQIVRIFSVIPDGSYPTRVTLMENFTANVQNTSFLEGVYMANPPVRLREPIIGRVVESSIGPILLFDGRDYSVKSLSDSTEPTSISRMDPLSSYRLHCM
jgi:hypothetical protein